MIDPNTEAFDFIIEQIMNAHSILIDEGDPGDYTIALIDAATVIDELAYQAMRKWEDAFQRPIEMLIAERSSLEVVDDDEEEDQEP